MTDEAHSDGAAIAARLNAMSGDSVIGSMTDWIERRELHSMVKALNREVFADEPERREAARTALDRMGFL